ncbi:MAG: carboxymuconolactone decarboxylase family protein [Candidatus Dadabacteria bacterium]|nr:carboxymuconolactone decarboxylase family protein [Candidatus Dadabacteria bacterium]NIS10072.1 carboxymuconolactone decarboxylase family protein [Candidatus Dadabacteria bacterium]NIV42149.1 carboxymuconolactone decarboxylase family protein [Candidatus Dadabacteria bacterium]NIX16458.1 carboxymuconolactone decarboxylase family protein [Candidatus Dadabacteria bacterium]NIY23019.1 carboxymuconolactone decarboxylase family protein [Candidatus Dadabacteria bacterium]
MSNERFETGKQTFEKITGDVGKKFLENLRTVAPDFADYLVEFPFGAIYSRPGFDIKTREIITLSSLATQGNAAIELKAHIKLALNAGVTREQIIELFMQISVYAGFPAAVNAMLAAKDVFKELDRKK